MSSGEGEMFPEVVSIPKVPITGMAVYMPHGLSVVFPQPVITLEYPCAGHTVVYVDILEVIFKLVRVVKGVVAVPAIVVLGALDPVLL